ncbi:16S rRNA (guanine(527)-N(7))-methyltransferase RsmG [Alloacidobacterium sp.]|uniref:16S rRNA (guanine(527)-N(7))-methyltransferase RsmG n=1 Tax=Alloacidobacterium sp. TaxID=2951999 RepID=UPI002D2D2312|nr:16S rRNA (guanine(527)-N(7))-methyltransferase RsmG [Alloacidobacterium sp.]HYK38034.1 16S rRNA (guanine(527)-N(7))-methyltransferase RsmG [Alloacidobacterium sp.]
MMAVEIEGAAAEAGLEALGAETAGRFAQYLDLLLKWNARLNLTAIREPREIVQRHFIECIFAARHLPAEICSLLDFGSGGGFPGIPIALCRPEIQVTLGESQSKKAAFLREAIRILGIGNAEVYNGRVESLNRKFDAVTLRAVDKMQEACRAAIRDVAVGGYLILFLSEGAAQNVVSELDQIDWTKPILLPISTQRFLLVGRSSNDVPRGTPGG